MFGGGVINPAQIGCGCCKRTSHESSRTFRSSWSGDSGGSRKKEPGNAAGEKVVVGGKINNAGNQTRVEYLPVWICKVGLSVQIKLNNAVYIINY